MVSIESSRDVLKSDEAADRQSGRDEQHERQCDLAHDERRTDTALAGAAAAAGGLFQRVVDARLQRLARRRETEEEAGRRGDREPEEQHRRVDAHIAQARRADGNERADEPHREDDAAGATGDGEQHALSEQLRDDAPARRAERDADRHFLMPCGGARDQQAGDVCGRDEQQQADGGEQHQQRGPDAAHEFVEVGRARRRHAGRP